MDYTTTSTIAILILLVVLILVTIPVRRRPVLRPIRAYDRMIGIVGQTVESDHPLHVSFGSAGIGGESTLIALTAAELAYQLVRRAAVGDHSPLLTVANPSALPLAQDTLRRAFHVGTVNTRHNPSAARWLPSNGRSLAFAAALSAMLSDEKIGGSVLVGTFGAELALVLVTSSRMNQPAIAVSDRIEGQAVAYALGEKALIGEEMFVSSAYLDDKASEARVALTLDMTRYLLIAGMLVALLISARG